MAFKAGIAFINITANTFVFTIGRPLLMAGGTGKDGIVAGIRMAFSAGVPFSLVLPGINREILTVMFKGGRCPRI